MWFKAYPDRANAKCMKRHASKLKRTPSWLSEEQLEEITGFYTTAKELQWLSQETLEVDHIVPLQGKDISGLHVPWNLQILPKSTNCSKGNR
jgi:5-methylcytosine-specific restriction endonuclease McrA